MSESAKIIRMSDYCRNGHDLRIVGRAKQGWCNECKRAYERDYHARHKETRNAKRRIDALPLNQVKKRRAYDRSRDDQDRHSDKEKRRRWWSRYDAQPERRTDLHAHAVKRRYGLDREGYARLVKAQDGLCAACGKPERVKIRGKIARLCVDHDHQTNEVRALLCNTCNRALGLLNEDPNVLFELANYILRFRRVEEVA